MSFEEIFNFEVLRRVITNTVYLTLKYFFYVFLSFNFDFVLFRYKIMQNTWVLMHVYC